jgi:hypothetical protein
MNPLGRNDKVQGAVLSAPTVMTIMLTNIMLVMLCDVTMCAYAHFVLYCQETCSQGISVVLLKFLLCTFHLF